MTRRSVIHTGAAYTAVAQAFKASPNDKISVGVIGTTAPSTAPAAFYSEKPMTYRTSEGPEIIRAAQSSGRIRWRCYEDYSCGIATVMATGELYRWKESRDHPEGRAISLGSSFNNQFSSEAGFQ